MKTGCFGAPKCTSALLERNVAECCGKGQKGTAGYLGAPPRLPRCSSPPPPRGTECWASCVHPRVHMQGASVCWASCVHPRCSPPECIRVLGYLGAKGRAPDPVPPHRPLRTLEITGQMQTSFLILHLPDTKRELWTPRITPAQL